MDHLRVSTVQETKEESKYVEIPMANNDSDQGNESESQADFYQPIGLSPSAAKNRNDASN